MDKWEIKCIVVNIQRQGGYDVITAKKLFNKNKDGLCPFDMLQAAANEGWELVNVTFINDIVLKNSHELLYSFKRKLQ